ncbi:hypothetical protein LO80_03225 [Candidatus Francisella endociliophora]|uniref:Uncharacterized protein n=1 Tax=Candidatus Francisella endociliophora TaxID=653937 RepID=A0A097ENE1_9GAMM|nr:hypothetical protein [Francisella sp. FSC1006]AIT09080.1 hypothetical protein LO80_03225 [Francisella sp. FSC1006]
MSTENKPKEKKSNPLYTAFIWIFLTITILGFITMCATSKKSEDSSYSSSPKEECRQMIESTFSQYKSLNIKWFSGASAYKHSNGRTTVRMDFDIQNKSFVAKCLVSEHGGIIDFDTYSK